MLLSNSPQTILAIFTIVCSLWQSPELGGRGVAASQPTNPTRQLPPVPRPIVPIPLDENFIITIYKNWQQVKNKPNPVVPGLINCSSERALTWCTYPVPVNAATPYVPWSVYDDAVQFFTKTNSFKVIDTKLPEKYYHDHGVDPTEHWLVKMDVYFGSPECLEYYGHSAIKPNVRGAGQYKSKMLSHVSGAVTMPPNIGHCLEVTFIVDNYGTHYAM